MDMVIKQHFFRSFKDQSTGCASRGTPYRAHAEAVTLWWTAHPLKQPKPIANKKKVHVGVLIRAVLFMFVLISLYFLLTTSLGVPLY